MTESIASVVTSIESDDEEEEEKEEEEEEEVKKELETLTIEETKRSSSRASSGRSIHTQVRLKYDYCTVLFYVFMISGNAWCKIF